MNMELKLTDQEFVTFFFINDVDLGWIGRSILGDKFGKEETDTIYYACKDKNKEAALSRLEGLKENSAEDLIDVIEYAEEHIRKGDIKKLSDTTLFKMIKSEDEKIIKKGKEYYFRYTKNYIYKLIHKSYETYTNCQVVSIDDFLQAATEEMLKALDSYDLERGTKAITYVNLFLRHGLETQVHFLEQTSTHYSEKNKAVKRAINQLNIKGITNPSVFQIASLSHLSPSDVKAELDYIARTSSVVYIDAETEDQSFLDRYDPLTMTPDDIVISKEKTQAIYDAIEELPDRMKEIFLCKYVVGLKNSDVAKRCNCSLNDVKEACNTATKRLRRSEHIRKISNFTDKAASMMDEYSIPLVKGKKSSSGKIISINKETSAEEDLDDILNIMAAM